MSYAGAGAATTVAAVIADAIKASGVVVRVEPGALLTILSRTEKPLVVVAQGGVFKKNFQYLTSYKGLAFFAKSPVPLELDRNVEVIAAKKISVPEM